MQRLGHIETGFAVSASPWAALRLLGAEVNATLDSRATNVV